MRVGKSLPASIWIDNPQQGNNTYIICIKKNKQSWLDMGTRATVLTKEEFKKAVIVNPTAIVIDELHKHCSPLFVKGRSKQAEVLYNLVKTYPNCNIMGLSATLVKQDAWSLHTAVCYIGVYYDWRVWQREFFELKKLPFLRFPAWFPKDGWRERMLPILKKHADVVALKDVVEYLPPAETRIITIKGTKYVPPKDEVVTWVDEHRHEQIGKLEEILELGYKKLILVCKYTSQIDELAEALQEYKPVFILDGRTKNAEDTIKQAQDADECYLIAQSAMGEGFDGWMFGGIVFVSMGHSVVEFTQMMGRQRHPLHLKVTETIFLQGGKWDRRVYTSVMEGHNFNPHNYED